MKFQQNNKQYHNMRQLNNENLIAISAEALECKICYDLFDQIPGLLKCGHSFCYKCINLIRAQASCKQIHEFQCPLCIKSLSLSDDTIPNYAFDEVLQYATLATQNNGMPQTKDQSKLLKTLEVQKQLYAQACKTLESVQKEKMRTEHNEVSQLMKDIQNKEVIIFFLCLLLIILFAVCVFIATKCGQIPKSSF